jgi:hypothetical protein
VIWLLKCKMFWLTYMYGATLSCDRLNERSVLSPLCLTLQEKNGDLSEKLSRLRAETEAPQQLPPEVMRSLAESRDALAELSSSLAEQEADNVALRAELDAMRSSADIASDAAHGAMVAALRAKRAASGESGPSLPELRSLVSGANSSRDDGSNSPLSAAATRILRSGDAALASRSDAMSSKYPRPAEAQSAHVVGKLRAAIASKDATIAALRSECLHLTSQIAALQAELAIYRKVDVYSETLHREMIAMSRSKQQQLGMA